jgi:hypothetical protein
MSTDKFASASSWGDWMKAYKDEKHAAPVPTVELRVHRVTANETNKSDYNPILGRHRAADTEASLVAAEGLAHEAARTKADQRVFNTATRRDFSIISNKTRDAELQQPVGHQLLAQRRALTGAATASLATTGIGSLHYKPFSTSGVTAARAPAADLPPGTSAADPAAFWGFFDSMPANTAAVAAAAASGLSSSAAPRAAPVGDRFRRDFDVVSNRYWHDDAARRAAQHDEQCARAAEHFASTYAVDIIAQRFVSPTLEQKFQEQRLRAERWHGLRTLAHPALQLQAAQHGVTVQPNSQALAAGNARAASGVRAVLTHDDALPSPSLSLSLSQQRQPALASVAESIAAGAEVAPPADLAALAAQPAPAAPPRRAPADPSAVDRFWRARDAAEEDTARARALRRCAPRVGEDGASRSEHRSEAMLRAMIEAQGVQPPMQPGTQAAAATATRAQSLWAEQQMQRTQVLRQTQRSAPEAVVFEAAGAT